MGKIIVIILGLVIVAISVVLVYDARLIATEMFSSNEINETTKTLKIVGFVVLLIGLGIVYLILR